MECLEVPKSVDALQGILTVIPMQVCMSKLAELFNLYFRLKFGLVNYM